MFRKKSQTINDVMNELIGELGLEEQLLLFKLNENFEKIVGRHFAENIRILKLHKKELHISIENSAWKTEVFLKKQTIIKEINIFFGFEAVNMLIIR